MDVVARYRAIEVLWMSQNWDEWAGTVSPEYRFEPGVGPVRDLAATLAWSRGMFVAFPDLSQEITAVLPGGEASVVGVTICRGTQTGPLDLGLGATLPPTGRAVEFTYAKVLTFDAAGLVVRDQQFLDVGDFLGQLTSEPG
jgi:predicted ester cyclase